MVCTFWRALWGRAQLNPGNQGISVWDPGKGDPNQGDPNQGDPHQGDPHQGDPGSGPVLCCGIWAWRS